MSPVSGLLVITWMISIRRNNEMQDCRCFEGADTNGSNAFYASGESFSRTEF